MTPTDSPPPPPQYVKIVAPDRTLYVRHGDGPAQISDGLGGWTTVDRPDDVAMVDWTGQQPLRMNLPLILDGFAEDVGVQRDLDRLLALGLRDGDDPPPAFTVSGPVPFSGTRWVMESTPEFGEAIRGSDERLLRQELTLALIEYIRADRIKFKKRKAGGKRTYTTKAGDTLRSIAAKLKPQASTSEQADYAQAVGKLNGIRDVRRKLDKGRELRLP